MDLVEIARELGIEVRKTARSNGGEYHSPCPSCGGHDRFMIWPQHPKRKDGGFYCRQCGISGGAIKFLIDFQGLSFNEAMNKLRLPIKNSYQTAKTKGDARFFALKASTPTILWRSKAREFVADCQKALFTHDAALDLLRKRGIAIETAKTFQLGYNPKNCWDDPQLWGINNDECKKIWLPKGIVIPTFVSKFDSPIKIKIRRSDWFPDDKLAKYVEVSESMKSLSVYGNTDHKVFLIVESELDAILVQQLAADLVCCIALGGASKKPDQMIDYYLRNAKTILVSLDRDDAGSKAYHFWKDTYCNVKSLPITIGKSPGDAHLLGLDLRTWLKEGIAK